jgi:hypothetical protein
MRSSRTGIAWNCTGSAAGPWSASCRITSTPGMTLLATFEMLLIPSLKEFPVTLAVFLTTPHSLSTIRWPASPLWHASVCCTCACTCSTPQLPTWTNPQSSATAQVAPLSAAPFQPALPTYCEVLALQLLWAATCLSSSLQIATGTPLCTAACRSESSGWWGFMMFGWLAFGWVAFHRCLAVSVIRLLSELRFFSLFSTV